MAELCNGSPEDALITLQQWWWMALNAQRQNQRKNVTLQQRYRWLHCRDAAAQVFAETICYAVDARIQFRQ